MRLRIKLIGYVLVVGACGSGSETMVEPPDAAPASATITMSADRFIPDTAVVRVGGTVLFVNQSGVLHDVDFGTPQFHIKAFDAGTRSLVFPAAGTLSYFCNSHAGMEATLVVR